MTNSKSNGIRTKNIGGELRNPRFVVLHFTAGGSLKGAVDWLCNPSARASAHLVVGRDGEVASVVPTTRVAWHAGKSEYCGYVGLNNHSIGIEMVNFGPLKRSDQGVYTPVGAKTVVQPEDVFEGKHKNGVSQYSFWQMFPDSQVDAVDKLLEGLFKDFKSLKTVIGHDDCAPLRKVDCGPAFDEHMSRLQAKYNR